MPITKYVKPPHKTDSFRPKEEYRTVITSWEKGVVELHLLKFPPSTDVTTFWIIGRLDPEEKYMAFSLKPATEFIPTYEKFLALTEKLDKTYYANGALKQKDKS